MTEDKTLTCATCGKAFLWSAAEQEFYREHDFSEPRHCHDCREKRKQAKRNIRR